MLTTFRYVYGCTYATRSPTLRTPSSPSVCVHFSHIFHEHESTVEFKNSFNAITKFFSLRFFAPTIRAHTTYRTNERTNVVYDCRSFVAPSIRLCWCSVLCSWRNRGKKRSYKYKIMKNYTKLFACFMIHISIFPFFCMAWHSLSCSLARWLGQGSLVGCLRMVEIVQVWKTHTHTHILNRFEDFTLVCRKLI